MTVLRSFSYLVGAALFAAALGGLFGSTVALVSPELVKGCGAQSGSVSLVRNGAGIGMVLGLLLGTVAMGFSLLLIAIARPRDR